ncbi:hypothetical protein TPL01_21060 [Sulfuriferula plumbiphila]|uniref:Uncharacterized protein n=1 Tax=Sulfuriferula plumbiphila TaxID=171865 RepID=A0A512L8Z9_9PROT|nr:hypothetical protein [Sulfuriferula plumbiphila]BBP04415.1 hypothetical protein SFPGR_18370 [Sulfuriferula plumbiphila]GEP30968.1 hypothetical protein TPL01_21060 [Sulfuriferula plumbiphila]
MADTDSNITANPYFTNIERAPYELGHLLRKLPEHFSAFSKQIPTAESRLIAAAATRHAGNANETLMRGLDTLGRIIFAAADNEALGETSSSDMRSLGSLLSHLAIEAQFLQETQSGLEFTLQELAKKSVAAA